jgi:hypothetical protein
MELHQVIRWVQDDAVPLIHVRSPKFSGKTRFLNQIAKLFYNFNKFSFKISFKNLLEIQSLQQIKDLLDSFDADLKASQKNTALDMPLKRPSECPRGILYLLDNAHCL